jgi:hypothetical protein
MELAIYGFLLMPAIPFHWVNVPPWPKGEWVKWGTKRYTDTA